MKARSRSTEPPDQSTLASGSISQGFYVHTWQVSALTPTAARELWMSLWGRPEVGQQANHAEIEFVPDGKPIPPPRYTENPDTGVNRIGIWYPVSQFERVTEILRNGRSVRCCYYEEKGHDPIACVKDWNTSGSVGNTPVQELPMSAHLRRPVEPSPGA